VEGVDMAVMVRYTGRGFTTLVWRSPRHTPNYLTLPFPVPSLRLF